MRSGWTGSGDYDRNGLAVSWVWRTGSWIPQVIYARSQPGWVLDLDNSRLGLFCGEAHDPPGEQAPGTGGVRSAHWPSCPGDKTEIRWMPLRRPGKRCGSWKRGHEGLPGLWSAERIEVSGGNWGRPPRPGSLRGLLPERGVL